jgi:hypothetical protein
MIDHWRLLAAVGACLFFARWGAPLQACSIDGKPTLTVNGHVVMRNSAIPAGSQLRLWAPFVFPSPLRVGHTQTLAEIAKAVPLAPEAFKTPWRWNFGDGSEPGRGTTVHHIFRKPGVYKVTVAAFFPSYNFWYTFDAVQLRLLRG